MNIEEVMKSVMFGYFICLSQSVLYLRRQYLPTYIFSWYENCQRR